MSNRKKINLHKLADATTRNLRQDAVAYAHRPPTTVDNWHCTRDGVTEPCGDCDGCRYDQQAHLERSS